MYVNTTNAFGFSRLKDNFGIPQTTSDMIELFGQYCGNDHWCFWMYDPEAQFWSRHEIVCRMPEFEGITREERDAFQKVNEQLAELPAPPLPADRSTVHREKPFLYKGFTFQWLFIPELGRWEILPLGRYDSATSQR